MKCERCHEKEAVFFYEEIVNGERRSFSLCADCAAEMGLSAKKPSLAHTNLSDLFADLFGIGKPAPAGKTCPDCGASFAEIAKIGKVLCPRCYDTFADELEGTLRSMHGSATHTGRAPAARRAVRERADRLDTLRRELNEAIAAEDFERAATLRDEIRAIEKQ